MNLNQKSEEVKSGFNNLNQRLNHLKRTHDRYSTEIKNIEGELVNQKKSQEVLKNLLDKLTKDNVDLVSKLVTEGLRVVVDDQNVEFKAEIEQKKDLWIKFYTINGNVKGDVLDSFGGMLACLESFILRVICILKLKLRRILILDEAFSQVSREYLENTSYLIKQLCDRFNIDMLLVTHKKELLTYADNVYYAKQKINNDERYLVLEKNDD